VIIMRTFLLAWGAVVALSGCAAGGGGANEQLQALLAEFDTETDYAATERCLSTFRYDDVEILDDRHLLFEDATGDDVWLNTLRNRCPGLTRNDTLAFELTTGNQLCSLDTVEVIENILFWRRTGPVCTLGEFHQLTEAQAQLLREAM
jgi:hypothetical protein